MDSLNDSENNSDNDSLATGKTEKTGQGDEMAMLDTHLADQGVEPSQVRDLPNPNPNLYSYTYKRILTDFL
jgi:hypothetical protein